MILHKLNVRGFAHYIVPIAGLVILAIGGTFVLVLKANPTHSKNSTINLDASNSHGQQQINSSTTPKTSLPSSTANKQSTSSTAASKPSTSTTQKTASSGSSSSSTNTSPQQPAQTPLSALITLITNLDNGSQVNVSASNIGVPGPITTAQARPIVFTVNGQAYFAYRQGQPADFTTTPSQTANTMAIVQATSSPTLVPAHLDKAANLVDANFAVVGYSTGGN